MKEGKKKNKERVWQVFWKQRYLQMFVFAGCRLRADFQLCSDGGADYRLQRLQDHRRTERNVYKSMGGSEIFQRIFYGI